VVTTIQAVPGVAAAVVTALHLEGETPALHEVLVVRGARFDPIPSERDRICPAQLLFLDTEAAVELTEMSP
jgi:hypothetical protein